MILSTFFKNRIPIQKTCNPLLLFCNIAQHFLDKKATQKASLHRDNKVSKFYSLLAFCFFVYFCIDKSTKNARSMSAVGFAKGSAIEALIGKARQQTPGMRLENHQHLVSYNEQKIRTSRRYSYDFRQWHSHDM